MKTFKSILAILAILAILLISISKGFGQPLSVTLTNTPVCNHDGQVIAAIQNGTPPYTLHWQVNGGTITNNITSQLHDTLFNVPGGYITVTVAESGGSTTYASIWVSQPFQIVSTVQPDTCPLQTGAISISVTGGTPAYTYAWTFNGNPFGGNTNSLSNLQGGYYDCSITDNAGCNMLMSENDSFPNGTLVWSVNNIVATTSSTPANCLNGTATVSATGGTAPFTYLWSNGQTMQSISGLSANSYYNVTVTDANSCFQIKYQYITSNINININTSITPAHCSFADGAITAIPTNGTSPYNYLWSNGYTTNTISNLTAGYYTITVSDNNGCQQKSYLNVLSLTPVNSTYTTTPSQCTTPNGTATLVTTGGITPYSYLWYTTPQQTTSVATGLDKGNYNFVITDAQGCTRSGIVTVQYNTTLQAIISYSDPVCTAQNGTASLVASGGSSPYSYAWSNGQTGFNATGIGAGTLYGTVTDAIGCSAQQCIYLDPVSPVTATISMQIASCIFTNDGSITAVPSNGTPPYQYNWSNGATTQTVSNLLTGIYWVSIVDANGCDYFSGYFLLGYNAANICYGIIQGYVFNDLNGNCIKDNNEPGIEHIPVWCHETNREIFTDASGFYYFNVPVGNVTIEQLTLPYRFQSCQSGNYIVNMPSVGVTINQDIADTLMYLSDYETEMYNLTQPVVGGDFVERICYWNKGTLSIPYNLQYDYDVQCPFAYSFDPPASLNTSQHLAEWNSPTINPLEGSSIDVTHNIASSVPINTMLFYSDTILPYSMDTTWWDNYDYRQYFTLGSFDPNYKEVSPKGSGTQGFISQSDSVLEYVIHFQNIGNWYAENIMLVDQLDNDLDWTSLRLGYSTHVHSTEITSDGKLVMKFNYIHLPAISQDTVGSNGFAVYTIHLKPNLADGTQINNSAAIFFDENPAIITNTTLNTIKITGIEEQLANANYTLFPNPSSGIFNIQFKNNEKDYLIKVKNIIGQEIYSSQHASSDGTNDKIDLSKFSDGFYLLEISDGLNKMNSKIIVRH